MRAFRVITIAACLLASGACSATHERAPATARSSRSVTTPAGPSRAARMAIGTDAVPGVLAAWCVRGACEPRGDAGPQRFLAGDPNGVILFVMGAPPRAAEVVIKTPGGTQVSRGALEPGTTMAYDAELGAGRYVVTLLASWPEVQARWVFGVKGPAGKG